MKAFVSRWPGTDRYSVFLNIFCAVSLGLLHNVCIHLLLLIFIRGDLALFVHLTAGTFTQRVFGFTLWQPLTGSAVRAAAGRHPAGQPTDRLNAPLSHTWSSSYCRRLPRDLWSCCSYRKKTKTRTRRQLTCMCSHRGFSLADVIRKKELLSHMWLKTISRSDFNTGLKLGG